VTAAQTLRPELLEILTAPGTDEALAPNGSVLRQGSTGREYPVDDGIPIFVESSKLNDEKRTLQEFYEEYGWRRPEPGAFYNAQSRYGFDSRTLLEHRRIVNREQKRHFHESGNLFLDCASGTIPAKEYLEYSAGFRFHVCVDLTLSALKGARERLGNRGLYVNADGTRLPFKSNTFDDVLCSHTLYHMPQHEQQNALLEFCRVLKPGGRCVVYYNLGEHSLIGRVLRPLIWAKRLRNRYGNVRKMYSHHHPLRWFDQFVGPFRKLDVHVYRMLPNQVMKYLLPDAPLFNRVGEKLTPRLRRLEQNDAMAKYAQYVTVVLEK
jgi:ubiquinone/menaquinone biosynthesis C-methylase UbiE